MGFYCSILWVHRSPSPGKAAPQSDRSRSTKRRRSRSLSSSSTSGSSLSYSTSGSSSGSSSRSSGSSSGSGTSSSSTSSGSSHDDRMRSRPDHRQYADAISEGLQLEQSLDEPPRIDWAAVEAGGTLGGLDLVRQGFWELSKPAEPVRYNKLLYLSLQLHSPLSSVLHYMAAAQHQKKLLKRLSGHCLKQGCHSAASSTAAARPVGINAHWYKSGCAALLVKSCRDKPEDVKTQTGLVPLSRQLPVRGRACCCNTLCTHYHSSAAAEALQTLKRERSELLTLT